jgi:hypothetical protein
MTMKSEYDFSKAERGKFFRKNSSLELPVYLEAGVRDYLTERASPRASTSATSSTISSSAISSSSRRRSSALRYLASK